MIDSPARIQDTLYNFLRIYSGCSYRVTPLQFEQTERKLANLSSLTTNSTSSTRRETKRSLEWNDDPIKHILQVI